MKTNLMFCVAISAVVMASGNAFGSDKKTKSDAGARLYMDNCAICHGASGKGDGVGVEFLTKQPADLTVISRKNGGVFPVERIWTVIDGRNAIKGHGTREMPIWGQKFSEENTKAAEHYVDVPYDMEMYTRSRILAIIDYLNRIQVK